RAAQPQNPELFVRWFRQAAPYVHAFRGRTFVIAFGGEMFGERERLVSFVHDVNLLAAPGIPPALVHGGAPPVDHVRAASANFITPQPSGVRKGTDFQFTGAVRKVDAAAMERELDAGEV